MLHSCLFVSKKIVNDIRIQNLIILCGVIVVFLLSWLAVLWGGAGHFSCLFLQLTNIPCPLCGFSGGFKSILQGNWLKAFLQNPLSIYLFLIFIGCVIFSLVSLIKGSNRYWCKISLKYFLGLTLFIIVFSWLLKFSI